LFVPRPKSAAFQKANPRTDAALCKFDFETEKQELALEQQHQSQRDELGAQCSSPQMTRLLRRQKMERQSFLQNRAVDRRRLQERTRLAQGQRKAKLPPLEQQKGRHKTQKGDDGNASDYEYDEVDEAQGDGDKQRKDKGVQKVKDDPPKEQVDGQ
jgi:hypothetical protein